MLMAVLNPAPEETLSLAEQVEQLRQENKQLRADVDNLKAARPSSKSSDIDLTIYSDILERLKHIETEYSENLILHGKQINELKTQIKLNDNSKMKDKMADLFTHLRASDSGGMYVVGKEGTVQSFFKCGKVYACEIRDAAKDYQIKANSGEVVNAFVVEQREHGFKKKWSIRLSPKIKR